MWHEALSGSMHDYMAVVNGARQAYDDAATEVGASQLLGWLYC